MQLGSSYSPAALSSGQMPAQISQAAPAEQQRATSKQLTGADLITSPLTSDAIRSAMSKLQVPQQQAPSLIQQVAAQPAQQQAIQPKAAALQQGSIPDQSKLIQDLFTSPQEKREQRKLELKEQQIAKQEKAARFKATKEERKDIIQKAQSARVVLKDLDRMDELNKSGKLDTPDVVEFLKRSGLDIPALLNPDSQEFQKIAAGFLRDAKTYFGGRITNYDIEQFLKTIPSLSQTPEGRHRVIAGLKQLKRGDLAYNDALKEIMKENESVPPYDLLEQIEDRIEPKLNKVAEKFKEDISKPVPKQKTSALTTGLGAAAGSLLGAPGTILGGVGKLFA